MPYWKGSDIRFVNHRYFTGSCEKSFATIKDPLDEVITPQNTKKQTECHYHIIQQILGTE